MSTIEEVIRKYNSGQCSAKEKAWLENWYRSFELNDKEAGTGMEKLREEVWMALQHSAMDMDEITPATPLLSPSLFKRFWPYAAAAMIITGTLTSIFFHFQKPAKQVAIVTPPATKNPVSNEIKSGTSKAQLILADGNTLSLDSSESMQLTEKDGTKIAQQKGKLVYNDISASDNKILFNILSTPRGGEYQLVLPDGSKVWLNAASSLRFPTRFNGPERTVFLQGEAYFEVAKNAAMPFRVMLENETSVKVLGTHFNIMSYSDEKVIRTTLEEGKVTVTAHMNSVSLSPAKQAVMTKTDSKIVVSPADVEKALAWKNGLIEFDDDDLPYIMRQISRWYDVDVNINSNLSLGKYKGVIRRNVPLSDVMEILKTAGVNFKVEGKKVTVTDG
jgi:transmembrane sensor